MDIRRAVMSEADWLQSSFANIGWTKPAGYFAQCLQRQENGDEVLLIAVDGTHYAGHLRIAWIPDYPYFRANNIPEIQDLNVLPVYRRQGVATKLVDAAEALMRERSNTAGIGVGLYADYGAAQRMYVKRGYVPDGRGVAYNNQYVKPGAAVPVDDDLVLYLTKAL
jgi:GNAT superfamily N-acetyltransferase